MELAILLTLIVATFATALGCSARTTRQAIVFLSAQAAIIGFEELTYCVLDLLLGLQFEALVDFLATFAEWSFAAIGIPLLIHWGMKKTENTSDEPFFKVRKTAVPLGTIAMLCVVLSTYPMFSLSAKLDFLPFSLLMVSLSFFLIITTKNSLRVLIGINMAKNALYPMYSEGPLIMTCLILSMAIFITAVGVYVIVEAYRNHGTLLIDRWRSMD